MTRTITVFEHDPKWRAAFLTEAEVLQTVFGPELVAVHHIGSTAVPGLPAKPVIDLLVTVRDIEQVDQFNAHMIALGYEPRGAYFLPGRRYFPRTLQGRRTHHAHVWQHDHPEVRRHLAFRDYLIGHPARADAYGRLKQALVTSHGGDNERYIAGKAAFCQETERLALLWQDALDAAVLNSTRLELYPLSAAQLYFCLSRRDQLQAALGFPLAGDLVPTSSAEAIKVKLRRLSGRSLAVLLWSTYWLLALRQERMGIGLAGFKGPPDAKGTVELGYGMDPGFRGQGYMTEAVQALIAWALTQEGCKEVTAATRKDNPASMRVLEKAGLRIVRETALEYRWALSP